MRIQLPVYSAERVEVQKDSAEDDFRLGGDQPLQDLRTQLQ